MTELASPSIRSFYLIDWAVADSFRRVEVQGAHSLTNQILRAQPQLTYDRARALAEAAWDFELPQAGTFTVEASWG